MKYALIIYSVMGFVWISYASLHCAGLPLQAERKEVHAGFKQRQAEVLKDLWHISDSEINEPIDLFGERGAKK